MILNLGLNAFLINKIKTYIIALADDIDSLLLAFKINSFRAITHKSEEIEICDVLDGVYNKLFSTDKLYVENGEKVDIIDLKDILYIEALGDSSIVIAKDGQFVSNRSLKYWDTKLQNNSFFRCHKSYLVAINSIKYIRENNIYLKSEKNKETVIPIAVKRRSLLRKTILV